MRAKRKSPLTFLEIAVFIAIFAILVSMLCPIFRHEPAKTAPFATPSGHGGPLQI
ncbi:hypothetical protein CCAX7_009090 [Capsulimonas corticalis]|uniref:Uncharacterized protein n=1 Tax=Capsulimonas corticalis TaxID=2219043 RepID=A0A402CU43_9BACT|nr:hypothetical protein [Capsulimonas corticalis]BDI28858.1 hypothetical protein CCAX7_009090 [Capsulimonas corticalis]